MEHNLKACPFCGNNGKDRSYAIGAKELEPAFVYVHCERCGAQGPSESGPAQAGEAWNRRSDSASVPTTGE